MTLYRNTIASLKNRSIQKHRITAFILGIWLFIGGNSRAVADSAPIIVAASSVKFALEEIAVNFSKETGEKLKLNFGSSGNFTRQIIQNAPFELFISADESYVFRLQQQGLSLDKGIVYAKGRLALFIPHNSPLKIDANLEDLKRAINDNRLHRFAIANPALAPYGRIAKQVLLKLDLWQPIQKKLVLGENAAQAAQFALSGATQGGLIAYSYSFNETIKASGKTILLDKSLHQPLFARMVLLKKAGKTARLFYNYLQQAKAKAIFARYGFE